MSAKFLLTGQPADFNDQFARLANTTFNGQNATELKIAALKQAIASYLGDTNQNLAADEQLFTTAAGFVREIETVAPDLEQLRKRAVLRALSTDDPSPFLDRSPSYPDSKKGEFTIWTFHDVHYLEEKVHRQVVGRSAGASVRVMKGVSVRVGQYAGRVIERHSMDEVDRGSLTVTTARLHFSGARKAFRLFYSKLAQIEPHSDGLKVIRDTPTAKPQVFAFNDGLFLNEVFKQLG